MDKEYLSQRDQDELEYIDWWWEQKEKKKQEKFNRRRKRRQHLVNACKLIGAAVTELVLIFTDK